MIPLVSIILLGLYAEICRRSTRNGLLVLVSSLPIYLVRLNLFGLPTTLLELMFMVVFIVWAARLVQSKDKIPTPPKLILVATGLLILGGIAGLTQTFDVPSSLGAFKSFLIEPILLALMVWSVEYKKPHITDYLVALSIPAIIVSVFGIFQATTGLFIPDVWSLERRATGIFPYPNALGHFVAPIITLLFLSLIPKSYRKSLRPSQSLLFEITIILGFLAIAFAKTESALIAFTTVAIVGLLMSTKKHRKIASHAIVIMIIVGALQFSNLTSVVEKVTLQDWSGQTRIAQWEETWNYLTHSPFNFILGGGMNSYPQAVAPFHTHDYLEIFQQPHNIFLNIWVELGLLGLLAFLVLAGFLQYKTLKNKDGLFVIPMAGVLVEMTIHGLVDVPYFKNDLSMMTWVVLALLLISISQQSPEQKDSKVHLNSF